MTFTSEKLNENIINWVKDNIGNSFEFREHQLEAITNICLNKIGRASCRERV